MKVSLCLAKADLLSAQYYEQLLLSWCAKCSTRVLERNTRVSGRGKKSRVRGNRAQVMIIPGQSIYLLVAIIVVVISFRQCQGLGRPRLPGLANQAREREVQQVQGRRASYRLPHTCAPSSPSQFWTACSAQPSPLSDVTISLNTAKKGRRRNSIVSPILRTFPGYHPIFNPKLDRTATCIYRVSNRQKNRPEAILDTIAQMKNHCKLVTLKNFELAPIFQTVWKVRRCLHR